MRYNPQIHHRRSIRLKCYDYTQPGAYFVTICTYQRNCCLGIIDKYNVKLTGCGKWVEKIWHSLPHHISGVEMDAFIIMPNHLHGIIILNQGKANTLHNVESFVNKHNILVQNNDLNSKGIASSLHPYGTQSGSLSAIIQNIKSVSTKKINRINGTPGHLLWQRNYYEHVIRNQDELEKIRYYILDNPCHWDTDEENPNRITI